MQHQNSLSESQFAAFINAISEARVEKFIGSKSGNRKIALEYYLLNCALCEAFYMPLHFAEICTRNSVIKALVLRFGPLWYESPLLLNTLSEDLRADFLQDIKKEKNLRKENFDIDVIVEGTRFCFWEHLLTKRFERIIWAKGTTSSFPHAPAGHAREDIHVAILKVRQWRNRIMHHGVVLDRNPLKKLEETLLLIAYTSPTLAEWLATRSKVDYLARQWKR